MTDNIGTLDDLSPECRELAIELRQRGIGLMALSQRDLVLDRRNDRGKPIPWDESEKLMDRIRPHAKELGQFIRKTGRFRVRK